MDREGDLALLGARLFSEPALSADGSISCSHCHDPERAFADGLALATGIHHAQGTRNAPTLIGLRAQAPLFWDGRQSELETLVLDPLLNPHEHGLPDLTALESRLDALDYMPERAQQPAAKQVVPHWNTATMAIAAFLRTLAPEPATLERIAQLLAKHDADSIERQGAALFTGRAGCAACHLLDSDTTTLTDNGFHDHGIAQPVLSGQLTSILAKAQSEQTLLPKPGAPENAEMAALGRFRITGIPSDIGKFKTPALFNVAVTAPYMHDGSITTLDAAVAHEIYYSAADRGAGLDFEDRRALVAFLRVLTDDRYRHLLPKKN